MVMFLSLPGLVWPENKQSHLIDSLVNNYPLPPLLFHVLRDNRAGAERRICIGESQISCITSNLEYLSDGVQRLSAIFR
jgi:hypothetical protein